MPVWSWFFIAVAVIIVLTAILIGVLAVVRRRRTERLKSHFGPEYERAVEQTGGQRAAEEELVAREHKRRELHIVALSPQTHARYSDEWRAVQAGFVDNPARSVEAADRLVIEVMRERGYPIDDFEQRAADISVDHPTVVEHYRAAHHVRRAQSGGAIDTEAQREAFVHYRALFETLLEREQPVDTAHRTARK